MKKRWLLGGILFIPIVGTLLHFLYEWIPNRVIGIFSPINESLWENLKVFFWPYLFWMVIEYKGNGHKYKHYLTSKVIGLYIGLLTIIVLFYTISGAFGRSHLVIDLILYGLVIIGSSLWNYQNVKRKGYYFPNVMSIILVVLLILAFTYFTFRPPQIPLFIEL